MMSKPENPAGPQEAQDALKDQMRTILTTDPEDFLFGISFFGTCKPEDKGEDGNYDIEDVDFSAIIFGAPKNVLAAVCTLVDSLLDRTPTMAPAVLASVSTLIAQRLQKENEDRANTGANPEDTVTEMLTRIGKFH